MIIGRTKSICPVCLKVIEADKVLEKDGVYLQKSCAEHGEFKTLIWEGSKESYLEWNIENDSTEKPVAPKALEGECPESCGLCEEHLRKGCCVLLELTKRCNLNCPVCFASAGELGEDISLGGVFLEDISLEEIEAQYDHLMSHGGPFNIQLSGGEPTLRDDIPDIIRLGRKKGFTFFQLNTNGIRLAEDPEYLAKLSEAGLNTVFLQFDGVRDDVYRALRGRELLAVKQKAIENCKRAGIGVCLVPVIAPGINEDQVGKILDFAIERMPYVRGVHFQPISYFGRCSIERPERPITIPRILKLIEEQTGGRMKVEDFAGGGAENPYCSFHGAFRLLADGSLKVLPKRSGGCCCSTTSDDSRIYVENQWKLSLDMPPGEGKLSDTSSLDSFLADIHKRTFTVSGMLFQDAYNLDIDRLKRCYILEMDTERGMVPFCAYNLTNLRGEYLYRK